MMWMPPPVQGNTEPAPWWAAGVLIAGVIACLFLIALLTRQ